MRILFTTGMSKIFNQSGMRSQMDTWFNILDEIYDVSYYSQSNIYKEVDVLHCFGNDVSMYQMINIFKRKNTKIIISPNSWIRFHPTIQRILVNLDLRNNYIFSTENRVKKIYQLADLITANTQVEKKMINAIYNIPEGKITVIPNIVNSNEYKKVAGDLFHENYPNIQPNYFLNVSQIGSKRKNHLRLIKLWKSSYPDLVLIGQIDKTPYAKECINCAAEKSNVHLLGYFENQSELLLSAYSGAHTFILPSTLETPGISALEASLYNNNLIITKYGGTAEYFKEFAEYVDPNDNNSIIKAIEGAIRKPKINENLQNHIKKNYDLSNLKNKLLYHYQNFK